MRTQIDVNDVFRGSLARQAGLVTRGQLRGSKFRRLFQDVYAPADLAVTHELRCRGAALIVPKEAVLTGRSAATVRGVAIARTHDPVEFVVPEKNRFGPIDGIRVRRTSLKSRESRPWNGVRIARPNRVALDLLLRLSPRKRGWVRRLRIGVPDLDAFLRSGRVRRAAFVENLTARRNRGIRLARHAYILSDKRAESLPESELRVVLRVAGFAPTPQVTVRKGSRVLGRLDLALCASRVAIEYDGRWHFTEAQTLRDTVRRRALETEGWRFVIVTAERLATDYQAIIDEVRVAQGRL